MTGPLLEQVIVAATGPIVTALLALLVANQVTMWAQKRKDAAQTRESLSTEITETANTLYLALQVFWRAARDTPLSRRASEAGLANERAAVNEAYQEARIRGEIIEQRLRVYFSSPQPVRCWHRVVDLLTVRYFLLLEGDEAKRASIRRKNAGSEHSGLTEAQLDEPRILLESYRRALDETFLSIWSNDLDRFGRHLGGTASSATMHAVDAGR